MNKSIKLRSLIPKKIKNKYSGINLIGLMISSVLGVFIISVIIKISMTINNNLQLIQAYIELEQSARILQKFFKNIFEANGQGLDPDTTRTNDYYIDSTNSVGRFSMWYKGGSTSSAISCSGRQLMANPNANANPNYNDNQTTIFFNTTSNPRYITCKNAYADGTVTGTDLANPANSANPGTDGMPLLNNQQIVKLFIAAIVSDEAISPLNLKVVPVLSINASTSPPPSTPKYHSVGIKLAIILKSTQQVFNVARTVKFDKILNIPDFSFPPTQDKFLYKLVIIQAPFIGNDKLSSVINTRIIKG